MLAHDFGGFVKIFFFCFFAITLMACNKDSIPTQPDSSNPSNPPSSANPAPTPSSPATQPSTAPVTPQIPSSLLITGNASLLNGPFTYAAYNGMSLFIISQSGSFSPQLDPSLRLQYSDVTLTTPSVASSGCSLVAQSVDLSGSGITGYIQGVDSNGGQTCANFFRNVSTFIFTIRNATVLQSGPIGTINSVSVVLNR